MCCSTSATSCRESMFTVTALYSSGSCSGSNSTSRTGPMTWTTLPTLCFDSVFVAMILPLEGFRAADDFGQLLRDLRLTRAVEGALQDRQHVLPGVGRVLHRGPPGAVLGRRGL